MEQGFGNCGSGATGQNVIRPGASGAPHPDGNYTPEGTVSGGWEKVDDVAGQIGADGVGHDHFSGQATGGANSAGPWKQT
jgi:hypothetical protein